MQLREALILVQDQPSYCQIIIRLGQVESVRLIDFFYLQAGGQHILAFVDLLADIGSVIVFVFYISKDFFNEVFQRHDAGRTAKFIHHYGNRFLLLHEEFQKENPRFERMTRHLYDLERLMDTDFGKAALADPRMYAEIVKHRSIFNTIRGVDYRTHHPSRIDFIPPEKLAEVWRRDYERMQEYFIYGDSLPYDRLIARMAELRDRFRKVVMEDDFFSES